MKKIILTLLITFTALQGFSQKSEVEKFMNQSYKMMVSGDTIGCLKTLDSALHANYNDTIAVMLLQLSVETKEIKVYVYSLESFYDQQKDNARYMIILADAYNFALEYEKAIEFFNKALKELNYRGEQHTSRKRLFSIIIW